MILTSKKKRAQRVRKKVKKNNSERFRLSVFRSSKNISAQIIDDINSKTLVSTTSILVAEDLAKKALEKKITKVYFDRGSYKFHNRVKLFAETLRKNGLNF